jgi:hypothetical protein
MSITAAQPATNTVDASLVALRLALFYALLRAGLSPALSEVEWVSLSQVEDCLPGG